MKHNQKKPPRIAKWILSKIVDRSAATGAMSDFDDVYDDFLIEKGYWTATIWYIVQIPVVFPAFIANKFYWSMVMVKNYLKIALRNAIKNKTYSTINITGLSLGIAASLIIYLYSYNEVSYDRFHENIDNIYMVGEEFSTSAGIQGFKQTRVPLLPKVLEDYPEVTTGSRLLSWNMTFSYNDNRFRERIYFVDKGFFDVFTYDIIKGNLSEYDDKNTILLTEETAEKMFGAGDPVGKTFQASANGLHTFKVAGIIKDFPDNTSMPFSAIVPFEKAYDLLGDNMMRTWNNAFMEAYLFLPDQADPVELEKKFLDIVRNNYPAGDLERQYRIKLHAYKSYHLEMTQGTLLISILSFVALLTIGVASINFMNMSLAHSLNRAREIGIRKVFGAYRKQLIGQFFGESILISFTALFLGVVFAEIFLPYFNDLFQSNLEFTYTTNAFSLLGLFAFALGIGIISGAYPAVYLSTFRPVESLKGELKRFLSGDKMKNGLVVVQFAISVFLVFGTMTIWGQIEFMKNFDLNFDKDHVLVINANLPNERMATIRSEIRSYTGVKDVSFSSTIPGQFNGSWFHFTPEGWTGPDPIRVRWAQIDEKYFDVLGVDYIEGEGFSSETKSQNNEGVLINEATFKQTGWKTSVGKVIHWGGNQGAPRRVLGVVKNHNHESLHNGIEPVLYFYRDPEQSNYRYFIVKLDGNNVASTVSFIEDKWKEIDPQTSFNYFFVDEKFDSLYQREERIGKIVTFFSSLAIFISCLGLLAMVSYSIFRKTKEIGIRKVLGASAQNITLMLSKKFLKLVIIANCIALPIAYFTLRSFLESYPFRTSLTTDMFLITLSFTLLVSFVTIIAHTLKAALRNPANTLRYE